MIISLAKARLKALLNHNMPLKKWFEQIKLNDLKKNYNQSR